MNRTLVLSTTFPQYPGDPRGEFILRYWQARADAGERVRILAPRTAWCEGQVGCDRLVVDRIAYAPARISTLTGRFGILENIRERPWRALLVPLLWRGLAQALRGEIASRRPTSVAAHMLLPCGLVAASECQRHAIPYVLYGHGTDVDLALRLPGPWRDRLRRALERAERVYLPSEEKAERVAAALGLPQARLAVETMSHVVRTPVVASRSPPASDAILYLGRLIPQKGVADLLAAVALMQPRPRLHIAGDGPERRRLERLAARLGVPVCFHGFVQGDAKADLLRQAAVVCVPSRETTIGLSEGAPLVIREAFAYGVPVVATAVGGIPELCRSGGRARLVPASRPALLSEALCSVLAGREAPGSVPVPVPVPVPAPCPCPLPAPCPLPDRAC